ncbi:MAG TPA: hypothetical protein VFE46_00175 [Pirellulales bacterium]|nr:hypothetical protein [Pirellulales bacterium]
MANCELRTLNEQFGSHAGTHRQVLRVFRTIADLAGSDAITPTHLSEAVNHRTLDRQPWTQLSLGATNESN